MLRLLNILYDALVTFSEQVKETADFDEKLILEFLESSKFYDTTEKALVVDTSINSLSTEDSKSTTKISFQDKLCPPPNLYNATVRFNVQKPTLEQQEALDLCSGGILVNSFAGTGKTTFSGQVAEKLGYDNTLYTAFLKENASEARERVTKQAYTQDALAYHYVLKCSPFKDSLNPKLAKKHSDATALQMLLGLPVKLDLGGKTVKSYVISRLIQETVYNFCNSIEEEVSVAHVPKQVFSAQAVKQIRVWATAYWDFLISSRNHDKHIIKFSHLMKFWALRPDIQLPYEFSNFIVDEAQDTNGAFYQVMQNHIDRNFVVIGDRHQQLFQWRGAINTMNLFKLPKKSLTMSHRFGESIANVANNVLAKHSEPPSALITGNQDLESKIVYYHPNEPFPKDVGAILTRTRTEIISIAKNEIEQGHAISVKTEFNSIRFLCQNIIALAENRHNDIRHPTIANCYSLSNLETELENSPDGDLYFALKLYKKFSKEILYIIDQVERLNQPESETTRLISTTHALKGREWKTIVIASDYSYLIESPNVQIDDELCVLYVAITRAKRKAYMPYGLKPYFDKHNNIAKSQL
ncbi:DNA helicase [Tenacibaculum sp. KUL113]|nr:DNA helicase [Tenacibaculum sp. KUL113]